ncbi:methylmalonyl Co-A mutase-associated GTPase MeaB [Fluviispira multicolorata]|uniref:Methylmalonyl Co-A mutase-associated GTPase MeaB n=1 Tax=Fluviispira multicolorata TaxID=2654512 RepID=A0A833JDF2_9BACT|nr:methylmalonyl Co-A mutase-associated GTPase MeaB [Fluviispira multicolorata]KAB8028537.1 methylmalonyl Co-A mutase-associated GTPase MeaB [Fluviispira multicolorata]
MKIKHSIELNSLVELLIGKKTLPNVELWRSQIRALSKAITFVENDSLLAPKLLSHAGIIRTDNKSIKTRVIGITGLPGAGKSTLTNLLIKELRSRNKSVAVLAVDPSSSLTGGAILGDRIRMQDHFCDSKVFIRSMGSRGALGGVAKATRSAIRLATLLEFDFILVETVGIGQSESDIINIADTTALVLMPNSGDEIQLMKAGILQLANIYIINKCDLSDPSRMMQEIKENTMPPNKDDWCPPVLKTSATNKEGIEEIINSIFLHSEYEIKQNIGRKNRNERLRREVLQNILIMTELDFKTETDKIPDSEIEDLAHGKTTAMALAQLIYSKYIQKNKG